MKINPQNNTRMNKIYLITVEWSFNGSPEFHKNVAAYEDYLEACRNLAVKVRNDFKKIKWLEECVEIYKDYIAKDPDGKMTGKNAEAMSSFYANSRDKNPDNYSYVRYKVESLTYKRNLIVTVPKSKEKKCEKKPLTL